MNVLVVGAGAIGCLVGAKLALAGEQVTLVGRPRFVEAARASGLRLTDERGSHLIHPVRAATSVAAACAAGSEPFDVAVLTVKSYATAAAAAELAGALDGAPSAPLLLSLQNGVGNEETIAAAVDPTQVVAGTITTPVSVEGPAAVRVDRPRFFIGLSAWSPSLPTDALLRVQEVLDAAGFETLLYADARGMKWTKLLMNMLGNATSAILDAPPQEVFAMPGLVDVEIEAWREAWAVMRASRIAAVNLGGYPFGRLAPLVRWAPHGLLRPILRRQIGGARGGKMPSLHIDLHTGKQQSEVEWLNGAVVRQGEAVGAATPVNRVLTETLVALIGDPAGQSEWRRRPKRLLEAVARGR